MSYTRVPPAYYTVRQPGTPAQEGAPGWATAPVPNWGNSTATSFPARLAVDGLGAEPFFRAKVPFASFIRVGTSPWGRFPNGPAYGSPKEGFCSACVGVATPQPMGANGCPKCTIPGIGDQCLPCDQDTLSQPECEGCDPNQDHDPHGRAPERRGGGGRRKRDATGQSRRMDKAAPNAAVVTLAPTPAPAPAAPPIVAAPAVVPTPAVPPAATPAAAPGQVPWLAVGLGLGAGVALATLVLRVRHS